MAIINLRDFYPFYTVDVFVEVTDEVAAALFEAKRKEQNYMRRMYWNNAHYSLDAGDGIEKDALITSLTPHEIYERKMTIEQLYTALAALQDHQGRRVYAHYILGISQTEIAEVEGVSVAAVQASIARGLRNIETFFENFQ